MLRARVGDTDARDALVRDNLPLVHYALRRFRDRGAEYDDLFQWGCVGLIKAIDRFDPKYEVKFSTYAVPLILGEIRRVLRDDGAVHISRTIQENAARVRKCRDAFVQSNRREPTISELAQAANLSDEDALLAVNAGACVKSLDAPVGGTDDARLGDVLRGGDMEDVEGRIALAQMLKSLPAEERTLILRRYFRRHTQTEIARDMGVSQVQVSRMEHKILNRLRQQLTS